MGEAIAWAHMIWLAVYVLQLPAIMAAIAIAAAIREGIDQ